MTDEQDGRARATALRVQATAAAWVADRLRSPAGAGPRAYLRERGLDSALESPAWSIGYAPPGWTALTSHLRRVGFSEEEIIASGSGLRTRRGSVVDRLRDRITVAIRNADDDVVAFIGRAAPGADVPKYLNTPATVLYDKSACLLAPRDIATRLARGDLPMLVEGPFDAIAVDLANTPDQPPLVGVSPCGTTLTRAHVSALAGCHTVVVAFDSDEAGDRASQRAYQLLRTRFTVIHSVSFDPGTDPASALTTYGGEHLRHLLADTTPLADRIVDDVLHAYATQLPNAEARLCALRETAQQVAAFDPDDVARQAARLPRLLGLDQATVTRELVDAATRSQNPSTTRRPSALSTVHGPEVQTREVPRLHRARTRRRQL